MSLDDGVFVVQFPDGYRVAYAGAISVLEFFPDGSKEQRAALQAYFGESPLFKTQGSAEYYAQQLSQKYDTLTWGVCFIGEFPSFLPGTPPCCCPAHVEPHPQGFEGCQVLTGAGPWCKQCGMKCEDRLNAATGRRESWCCSARVFDYPHEFAE